MLGSLIFLVSILSFVKSKYNPFPDLVAVVICVISAVLVVKTKKYKLIGGFAILASFIVIVLTLFFVRSIHYTTPLWMFVHILFSFIVLNKVFGLVALAMNFACLFVYVYFFFPENLNAVKHFDRTDALLYMSEFVILAIAIGYILFTYVSSTQKSEALVKLTNRQLNERNNLIGKQKAEMEVMLKEIHHRVKNNLQIISSLLRLQSETLSESEREIYIEAVNRVSAMAIIHEKMYQTDSLSNFDLEEYIVTLIDSLFESYMVNGKVESKINVHVGSLNTKSIVPIAMMLNELVSNSVKHAFANEDNPKVNIIIADIAENQLMIEYFDNGNWVEKTESSFGLEIIDAMTQQMDGTKVRRSNEDGTYYIFQLYKIA
jgi:two-component sensor histidine kinase